MARIVKPLATGVVIVCLGVAIYFVLNQRESPGPKPPSPRGAGELAIHNYAGSLAANFEAAAAGLEDGTQKDGASVHKWLTESNAESRKKAFVAVDTYLDDNLAGDKWSNEKAIVVFRTLAKDFARAK